MKWLDLPPIWLLLCAVATWQLAALAPDWGFGPWAGWAGALLIGAGLAGMVLAVWEFNRARTTVVPHRSPSAIITTGIFRYSRNPIYLGDVLVLTGLILRWDAVLAAPLVLVLVWLLRERFIKPEERRLEDAFPMEFEAYRQATRRWL